MRNEIVTIQSQRQLTEEIYEMVLQLPGDAGETIQPGQFINIRLEGQYLRRPISICDWTEDTITIIYKTVGRGTEQMSRMCAGETLDILYPLGNGYDLSGTFSKPLLIGGGVGAPPMYGLCKELVSMGRKPIVLLGFGSTADGVLRNGVQSPRRRSHHHDRRRKPRRERICYRRDGWTRLRQPLRLRTGAYAAGSR